MFALATALALFVSVAQSAAAENRVEGKTKARGGGGPAESNEGPTAAAAGEPVTCTEQGNWTSVPTYSTWTAAIECGGGSPVEIDLSTRWSKRYTYVAQGNQCFSLNYCNSTGNYSDPVDPFDVGWKYQFHVLFTVRLLRSGYVWDWWTNSHDCQGLGTPQLSCWRIHEVGFV